MPNNLPNGQDLANEYLDCLQAKQIFDVKFKAIKQKLFDFSVSSKQKIIKTDTASLVISIKHRTVFPKYNQKGRKDLEKIVKDSGYWDQTLSFDVGKLADAYDSNTLPGELKDKLTPFAQTDDTIRIFVNPKEKPPKS